jgi:hypothetical protein
MIAKQRVIYRVLRVLLLGGIVVTIGLFMRGCEKFTIPAKDDSLLNYPGGTTIWATELEPDAALARGMYVVYMMEKDGTAYARFGRIEGLPGDVVGAQDGRLTVNGKPVGPIPGEAMGTVPPGKVLILATNPAERDYPDSRVLGFIPRERVLYRFGRRESE